MVESSSPVKTMRKGRRADTEAEYTLQVYTTFFFFKDVPHSLLVIFAWIL